MQHIQNWNDLRYVLAISRRAQLTEAAKFLGVDATTVSRRLATLEAAMGQRLYQRLADNSLELTEAGTAAAAIAERIETAMGSLNGGQGGTHKVTGVVRLTSVPLIINRILAPAAHALLDRHQNLRLELISDARDLSLTRREADMALRLARPQTGGMKTKVRRVGTLHYAPYAAAKHADPTALPWISYNESLAHLPQARWMAAAASRDADLTANLRVSDIETAIETVASGFGRSMFPTLVADQDERLAKAPLTNVPTNTARELWLLTHSEITDLPRTKAVATWIADTLTQRT